MGPVFQPQDEAEPWLMHEITYKVAIRGSSSESSVGDAVLDDLTPNRPLLKERGEGDRTDPYLGVPWLVTLDQVFARISITGA